MKDAPIDPDIALRIALAARTLPDTDPRRLLQVLADAVGLPPTAQALAQLKLKDFKNAAGGEFADMDNAVLKAALTHLKGEAGTAQPPLPEVEAYAEGDMPESIRVACASNGGERLDGHFGSCRRFLVYQVARNELRLIDIRETDAAPPEMDKNAYRAGLVADCQVLFVASIGGPAAAKVVRAGVHPIKKPEAGEAREELTALQARIGPQAPPWLAKAMGVPAEERVRFEQTESDA